MKKLAVGGRENSLLVGGGGGGGTGGGGTHVGLAVGPRPGVALGVLVAAGSHHLPSQREQVFTAREQGGTVATQLGRCLVYRDLQGIKT